MPDGQQFGGTVLLVVDQSPSVVPPVDLCCSQPRCERRAMICSSCVNLLSWPTLGRNWTGAIRRCGPRTCQVCHSPEHDARWCVPHGLERVQRQRRLQRALDADDECPYSVRPRTSIIRKTFGGFVETIRARARFRGK